MTVAVLFACADSHCKALDGVDLWDIQHDGRTCTGRTPLVAADALSRMALTLAYAHGHAFRRVAEPGRAAPSAKGRVWAVAFAFVAQYARADGRLCIERST